MVEILKLGLVKILNFNFLAKKSQVFKAKNNGHQNFTKSLGIPEPPPPYLPLKKQHKENTGARAFLNFMKCML